MKSPFFNRELSWVEFNARVLGEAEREDNPLLERLRFLTIVSSNFDEFFMVRVASLQAQRRRGAKVRCAAGLLPEEVLERLGRRVHEVVGRQYRVFGELILPALGEQDILFVEPGGYTPEQIGFLKGYFQRQLLPLLTPVRVEDGEAFPFTGNLRSHILFRLARRADSPGGLGGAGPEEGGETPEGPLYAFVQLPGNVPRLVSVPSRRSRSCFTLLEHVITSSASALFPGYAVQDSVCFRVSRDADLSVDERRDEDFVEAMEELLASRQRSRPIRLEVTRGSAALRDFLTERLALDQADVYELDGPIDLTGFSTVVSLPGCDQLRHQPWLPQLPPALLEAEDLWQVLRQRNVLLHHPYESFEPVVRLVEEAATDPDVLAIKMTLYRTGGGSPVIRALKTAAESGKQVTAVVELKARFDEERNIGWAEQLERAGVIVIYGIANVKVHAKALLVVRREEEGIRRYVHLATGNYNGTTAKLYTDFGLLSSDELLSYDTALFFNTVTGYSAAPTLRKLVMAPLGLKDRILQWIRREAEQSSREKPGHIMAKLNSLTDADVIEALYHAAEKGVRIQLNVRGPCLLVPGRKGLSENVHVVSIVGRFLEHARILYFSNNGRREVYLSSADWMPRNLERRVELLFPVEQHDLKARLIENLHLTFRDNVNAWSLAPDGTYRRVERRAGRKRTRSQEIFYRQAGQRSRGSTREGRNEFVVRRKPPTRPRLQEEA